MVGTWLSALQGSFVNALAIVAGGLIGLFLGNKIPDRIKTLVLQGIALAVLVIGMQMALALQNPVIVIFSLLLGGITGEMLGIEEWLHKAGAWLESRAARSESGLARAFVLASLVYLIGAMAVTGALESGLLGQHQTLYIKAILDGFTSIAFAATMGVGVCLSALPVLLYQGIIALAAGTLKPFLGPEVISELSGVGGMLIIAISLNMLELVKIKVANFLPAFVFVILLAGVILPAIF